MSAKSNRILIVDDDEDILTNLSDILSNAGYDTETAASSEIALQLVNDGCSDAGCRFDLCLLDYKMPGMDGIELYMRIRAANPNLRAIMITACTGEEGILNEISTGACKVLAKPVDIKHLLGVIREAVA